MYEKDKKQRITLRLDEQLFDFVKDNANTMGVSPSEFLRMMIHSIMITIKKAQQIQIKEVVGRENDKTNIDNIV